MGLFKGKGPGVFKMGQNILKNPAKIAQNAIVGQGNIATTAIGQGVNVIRGAGQLIGATSTVINENPMLAGLAGSALGIPGLGGGSSGASGSSGTPFGYAPAPSSSLPSWIWLAIAGAGALVLVLVLRKKA
jgi:hypothetical protein